MGVGVKGTSLLVDKASIFGSSQVKVVSCPVVSMSTFLGVTDVCTDDTVMGSTELLGVPLVEEAGGLCGELVQKVVGKTIFSGKETGKGADVGMLFTLSPAVKMQRAKRVLQIMVSRCWVPTRARATGEFVGTDRAHREPTAPPLPGGLVVGARGPGGTGGGRGSQANAARLR